MLQPLQRKRPLRNDGSPITEGDVKLALEQANRRQRNMQELADYDAKRAEAKAQQRQENLNASLEEKKRQEAYNLKHGAAERRAAEEYHKRLTAEIEVQRKAFDDSGEQDWWIKEEATKRARAVLAERDAQEQTIEAKVERLIRAVATIERRLDRAGVGVMGRQKDIQQKAKAKSSQQKTR